MRETVGIRPAVQEDGVFLGDMVVEAANWRVGGARPRHEVLSSSLHRRYLVGWMRPADAGVIAVEANGDPVGAAWYRLLSPTEPGFGSFGSAVPELIIGVRPMWRAQGVGRALLRALIRRAAEDGHSRISLSVERDNFAHGLYRSEHFVVVGRDLARDTMIRTI